MKAFEIFECCCAIVMIVSILLLDRGCISKNSNMTIIISVGTILIISNILFKKNDKTEKTETSEGKEIDLHNTNSTNIQLDNIERYIYVSLALSLLGLFFYGIPCFLGLFLGYKGCEMIKQNKDRLDERKARELKFYGYVGLFLNTLVISIFAVVMS